MVYSWVYFGDVIQVQVPLSPIKVTLLKPFTSLAWLMFFYFVVFVTTFIVFCVGSYLLGLSTFCAATAPLLFKWTTFLVVSWWIGFCVCIVYMIKLYFGNDIASFITDQTRDHTPEEMEERIFRKVFNEFDKNREGTPYCIFIL